MNSSALTVVATLHAKPGQESALKQELLALVPVARQEPGCLKYDLHQSVDIPGHFLFHETWTSKRHLEDHLARPPLKAFLAKADDLLCHPPSITLWERIG